MLRDTVTPTVIHVGKKVNVVPGIGEAEIDVRTCPAPTRRPCCAACRRSPGMACRLNR